jgi:hypothetical protein
MLIYTNESYCSAVVLLKEDYKVFWPLLRTVRVLDENCTSRENRMLHQAVAIVQDDVGCWLAWWISLLGGRSDTFHRGN